MSSSAQLLATAYNSQTKVVSDSEGNIFAAYTITFPNGSYVVQVAESLDSGATWSPLPATPSSANSSRAAIAIDSKGGIHLVWTEGIPGVSQIYYSSFDGSRWSPKIQLSTSRWYSGYPSVFVSATGTVRVVWYGFDGEYYQIFYSEYDGNTWSAPVNISHLNEDSVNPTIVQTPSGHVYVVWYALISKHFQIWFAGLDGNWTQATQVTSDPRDALSSSVAVNPSGSLDVVWEETVGSDEKVIKIYYNGSSRSHKYQVTDSSTDSYNPTQGFSRNGTLYIFWTTGGVLYGCAYTSGCAPFEVYSQGQSGYPSVIKQPGPADALSLLWTNTLGGETRVLSEQIPTGGPQHPDYSGVLLGLAVAAVAAAILWASAGQSSKKRSGSRGTP